MTIVKVERSVKEDTVILWREDGEACIVFSSCGNAVFYSGAELAEIYDEAPENFFCDTNEAHNVKSVVDDWKTEYDVSEEFVSEEFISQ